MRHTLNALLLLLALLLTGCAAPGPLPLTASPEMDQQAKRFAPSPDKARIYVYRNNYLAHIFNQALQVNGIDVGSLAGYSFMPLEVPAGSYKLYAQSENETTLALQVESGKNYYVQLNASMGVWTFRSELRQIPEADARQAIIDECKLVTSPVYPLGGNAPSTPAQAARQTAAAPASTALRALLLVQPASGYARIDEVERLPGPARYRENYEKFLTNPSATRALVVGNGSGFFSTGNGSLPELHKLFDRCEADGHKECWLYAWGSEVMWSKDPGQRISRRELKPLDAANSRQPLPAGISIGPNAGATSLADLLKVPVPKGFARLDEIGRVPMKPEHRVKYENFLANPSPSKALVLGGKGGFFSSENGDLESLHKSFARCHDFNRECWLYAWGNEVVWSDSPGQRISRSELKPL